MLETLRRIIQEVASAQDFRDALQIMVQRIANTLDTHACSIFLLDKRRGEYILRATQGLNPKGVNQIRVPFNKGLVGLVGEREEPINLADASAHPRFLQVDEAEEEKYRAFLGTPIIYHRNVLGVLIVQQSEPRRYDEAEEAFLVTLATQLGSIIAHAEATQSINTLFDPKKNACELLQTGIPGAPGVGIGKGTVIFSLLNLDSVPDRTPENISDEIALLETALTNAQEDIRILAERLHPSIPEEERELFNVYQRMLDKNNLGAEILAEIEKGNWAPGALRTVINTHIQRFTSLENEYLRDRASDIRDLGHRVLNYLQRHEKTTPQYSDKTILVGEDLTATHLAEVPEGCLAGIISKKGSGSSHIAILARSLGIPTVMGASDLPLLELQDKELIVDGHFGQIYVSPKNHLRKEFEKLIAEDEKLDKSLESLRDLPAETEDGHRLTLMVNTGLGGEISLSLAVGAEGVGLYRTEVPFLVRDRFPSGSEQRALYRQLLTTFAPRPVTMRTLDIGGDKALPYFPVQDDNPFLGWRGLRISLDHPDIFLVQIRAMLRASEGLDNLRIMLPMVTDVSEVDEALRLMKKAYQDVLEENIKIEMPQVGVMVEVPSAVYQARAIAKRVDFLSIGSNDLTQYILAVDRNNARVANLYDSLHPAVLRALLQVVESGHHEGKHVSICGEMASDPVALILLIAMGFDSLSMSPRAISRMKWVVRQFTLKKAAKLLQDVLSMESPLMIRAHLELALERAGLGVLIRAGR